MAVNKALIEKKLSMLNNIIRKVEGMEFTEEVLIEDFDIQDLLAFRLQQAVETAIDIATHLIAGLDLPRKETARDAFLLLGDQGIVKKELAGKMGKAADFRNRVVHGYNDFDFRLLYKDYGDDLKDLKEYMREVLKYIGKHES
jgi:uncharacterized protein YutE (UPF0331/DUF86 family)